MGGCVCFQRVLLVSLASAAASRVLGASTAMERATTSAATASASPASSALSVIKVSGAAARSDRPEDKSFFLFLSISILFSPVCFPK